MVKINSPKIFQGEENSSIYIVINAAIAFALPEIWPYFSNIINVTLK